MCVSLRSTFNFIVTSNVKLCFVFLVFHHKIFLGFLSIAIRWYICFPQITHRILKHYSLKKRKNFKYLSFWVKHLFFIQLLWNVEHNDLFKGYAIFSMVATSLTTLLVYLCYKYLIMSCLSLHFALMQVRLRWEKFSNEDRTCWFTFQWLVTSELREQFL